MLVLRHSDMYTLLHTLSKQEIVKIMDKLQKHLSMLSGQHNIVPVSTGSNNDVVKQPARISLITGASTTLIMPCATSNIISVKTISLSNPNSVSVGTSHPPRGFISVQSTETGELRALLNAEEFTAFRTALVSLIPLTYRGAGLIRTLTIFGAGKQSYWHIYLLLRSRSELSSIYVVNRTISNGHRLIERLLERIKFEDLPPPFMQAIDLQDSKNVLKAVSEADCIFTCTASRTPLFRAGDLVRSKKRYISAVGSYKPEMREFPEEILTCSKHEQSNLAPFLLLVDSKSDVILEAGELISAKVPQADMIELGELDGCTKEQLSILQHGNVLLKCVGMAIMDMAVSDGLLQIVINRNTSSALTLDEIGINIQDF